MPLAVTSSFPEPRTPTLHLHVEPEQLAESSESSNWGYAQPESDHVTFVCLRCSSNDVVQYLTVENLSRVREVDAIFVRKDEHGTYHVYSVVQEHSAVTYRKIMEKEKLIQERFPETVLDFRIRAHQGRSPSEAVPLTSTPVYRR